MYSFCYLFTFPYIEPTQLFKITNTSSQFLCEAVEICAISKSTSSWKNVKKSII